MIRTGETICAPATSVGGAIAVIRVSGSRCIEICDKVFFPSEQKIKFTEQKGYSIVYGEIRSAEEIIDEVLVSVFSAPHSYTGEDSVEISCHASTYIIQKILELLVKNGAVPAQPGEFTQRAFLNGKMDLSQAEAVADLIASHTSKAHRIAINQMRGAFSDEISILRADLLHFASLIELELDFGEEDIQFADREKLKEIVSRVLFITKGLTTSFSLGNAIKNGVPVAITGKTNTGKSSLLNLLLNEEKAIVSEIPGTTRDYIEDVIIIDGIQYRFIDTAGLRETKDVIENLGIKRTYDKIDQATIVLLVADVNEGRKVLDDTLRSLRMQMAGKEKKLIILINKTDADANGRRAEFDGTLELHKDEKLLFISAKTGSGIDNLKNMLGRMTGGDQLSTEDVIITNIRHYEALTQVSESLERVMQGLGDNIPADLIAIDIRQAIHYLGEITGEITD